MRKLIMWNLVTLDGCFEGEKSWDLPWHDTAWGEDLEKLSIEQLEAADALLFGRVTYEGMAAYWQTEKGRIADYMNSLPKLVCSRTLKETTWNNSTLIKDKAAEEIAKYKQQGKGDIYVFGSGKLSQTLMRAGLFDEYRIGIAPVVHGKGRLLFESDSPPQALKLVESRSTATGCMVLVYQPTS